VLAPASSHNDTVVDMIIATLIVSDDTVVHITTTIVFDVWSLNIYLFYRLVETCYFFFVVAFERFVLSEFSFFIPRPYLVLVLLILHSEKL